VVVFDVAKIVLYIKLKNRFWGSKNAKRKNKLNGHF
jgi:hypothetical protein